MLAAVLLLFVLVAGPTVFLFQTFVQNTGAYLSDIVNKTFNLYAEPTDWIGGWTLFYWGWWIAWSPFVGLFIARISRGRTIREFVSGVLLVPAGFTLFWMTVFGDTAIHFILVDGIKGFAETVQGDSSLALFAFLEQLPWSGVVSIVAIAMVAVFFVTSADSGALVVDLLASGGAERTPMLQRIFWSLLMGAVAIALLLADGLTALQTATIASALPFSVILLLSLWGLFKALKLDATKRGIRYQSLTLSPARGGQSWERRLRNMVMMPRRAHVQRFITDVVRPAFEDVADELRKQGYEVQVKDAEDDGGVALEVSHGEHLDFSYAVKPEAFVRPSLTPDEAADEEDASTSAPRSTCARAGRTMTSWAGTATRSSATSSTSTSGTATICTWCAERTGCSGLDAGGSARNRRRFHGAVARDVLQGCFSARSTPASLRMATSCSFGAWAANPIRNPALCRAEACRPVRPSRSIPSRRARPAPGARTRARRQHAGHLHAAGRHARLQPMRQVPVHQPRQHVAPFGVDGAHGARRNARHR